MKSTKQRLKVSLAYEYGINVRIKFHNNIYIENFYKILGYALSIITTYI